MKRVLYLAAIVLAVVTMLPGVVMAYAAVFGAEFTAAQAGAAVILFGAGFVSSGVLAASATEVQS